MNRLVKLDPVDVEKRESEIKELTKRFPIFFRYSREIDTVYKIKNFKLDESDEKSCIWITTLKRKLKSLGTAFLELKYRENGKTISSLCDCEYSKLWRRQKNKDILN